MSTFSAVPQHIVAHSVLILHKWFHYQSTWLLGGYQCQHICRSLQCMGPLYIGAIRQREIFRFSPNLRWRPALFPAVAVSSLCSSIIWLWRICIFSRCVIRVCVTGCKWTCTLNIAILQHGYFWATKCIEDKGQFSFLIDCYLTYSLLLDGTTIAQG